MNPVEQLIDTNEFPLDLFQVYDAMRFVESAHKGRKRWDGTDEFEHLLAVASRCIKHGFGDTESVVTGLLHDVVEDTAISHAAVHDVFGSQIAANIVLLTQNRGESRDDYLSRVLDPNNNDVVLAVKFADRIENVMGLTGCPDLPQYAGHVDQYFYELDTYFLPAGEAMPQSLADELFGHVSRAKEYFNKGEVIPFPAAKIRRIK